jgi:hypothetical protein
VVRLDELEVRRDHDAYSMMRSRLLIATGHWKDSLLFRGDSRERRFVRFRHNRPYVRKLDIGGGGGGSGDGGGGNDGDDRGGKRGGVGWGGGGMTAMIAGHLKDEGTLDGKPAQRMNKELRLPGMVIALFNKAATLDPRLLQRPPGRLTPGAIPQRQSLVV